MMQPERRGVEVADGAQPGALADRRRVGEQLGHDDVEEVEHVVLRARLQARLKQCDNASA
jgi:hypothetical protein